MNMGRKDEKHKHRTLRSLPNNSRFYILSSSILLSLTISAWLRLQIPSDQLFYIRLEQVFGFLSICFLYTAVIISPLSKTVGKTGWMEHLIFARRAIGVSAAYFACLHAPVFLWGQVGGLSSIGLLPERFQFSFLIGVVSLAILLVMAVTSFDKVITFMTPKRWKLLHRLIYGGGILIILHVWMIGTHIAYSWVKVSAVVLLAIFFALESLRIAKNLTAKYRDLDTKEYLATIAFCIWVVWMTLLLSIPGVVKNYHSEHHSKHPSSNIQGDKNE